MKILSIVAMLAVLLACQVKKNDGYRVEGDIQGLESGKITFSYFNFETKSNVIVDSAIINKGQFKLEGITTFPQRLNATITPGNYSFSLWLQNSEISIEGQLEKVVKDSWGRATLPVTITGSVIQGEQEQYDALLKPIQDEQAPFTEIYNKANMAYMKGMKAKLPDDEIKVLKDAAQAGYDALKPYSKRMLELNQNYINEHPSSYITASLVSGSASHMQLAELQKRYDLLTSDIKNSSIGQGIKSAIDEKLKVGTGSIASVFSKKDINGKQLSLSDFKGKYVLLDFWASWCKPCRAGNPHLIHLHKQYHRSGFEIIGIASDDRTPEAWHKAVKEDEIGIWHHVLNGDASKGETIGDQYNISSLPTKILVDPNGKIIARYGAGDGTDEDLDNKLTEIFGN